MLKIPPSRLQSGDAAPKILVLIIALAAVGGGLWYFTQPPQQEDIIAALPVTPAPQPSPDPIEAAPDIPQLILDDEADTPEQTPEVALPILAESDNFVREALGVLSSEPAFAQWLQTDNLLQKAVAIADGLAKGSMPRKFLPIPSPEQPFAVIREDEQIYLDEKNYQRFDPMIDILTGIPANALARVFHSLRPLLEQAYGDLGHSGDRVDNSIIAAIDHLLAAPDIPQPVALIQHSVHYQFADPSLEALSPAQKQIIRLGPDNRAQLFNYLNDLRSALLQQDRQGG